MFRGRPVAEVPIQKCSWASLNTGAFHAPCQASKQARAAPRANELSATQIRANEPVRPGGAMPKVGGAMGARPYHM